MNSNITAQRVRPIAHLIQFECFSQLIILLILLSAQVARAGSATWAASPPSNDWNTAANWTPATVPNGPADVATFNSSSTMTLLISADTEVNEMIFNNYFYVVNLDPTVTLTVSGLGLPESNWYANFVIPIGAAMQFTNSAVASDYGLAASYTNSGALTFFDSASAYWATINNGTVQGVSAGIVQFDDNATAANCRINNFGGITNSAPGGVVRFFNNASGASASLSSYGSSSGGQPSLVQFFDATSAPAFVSASGGYSFGVGASIQFLDDSTADGASVSSVYAGIGSTPGNVDISSHNPPGLTVASIGETSGLFYLGSNNLTVSTGMLDSIGKIEDGGIGGGTGGSLTKVGTGTLTLEGGSSYSGGTLVLGGILTVTNTIGSATGPGPVLVSAGSITGSGRISGRVTIGTGNGAGAFLVPGLGFNRETAILIRKKLILNSDATYTCTVNSKFMIANKVVAHGVIINGAQFYLSDTGAATIAPGTVFTAISNSAATPIAGTFSNLADGSTVTVGNNTFQVNYEGGDGNDMTLTVVP